MKLSSCETLVQVETFMKKPHHYVVLSGKVVEKNDFNLGVADGRPVAVIGSWRMPEVYDDEKEAAAVIPPTPRVMVLRFNGRWKFEVEERWQDLPTAGQVRTRVSEGALSQRYEVREYEMLRQGDEKEIKRKLFDFAAEDLKEIKAMVSEKEQALMKRN